MGSTVTVQSPAAKLLMRIPRLIDHARQDLGVREIRPNWSPRIQQMLAVVGIHEPKPWCAAAVATWCREALGGFPVPPYSGCQALYEWGMRTRCCTTIPMRGSIAVFWHADLQRYAHTGLVTDAGLTTFATIEGNTNPDGGRDGYGVFERVRPLDATVRFLNWWDYEPTIRA